MESLRSRRSSLGTCALIFTTEGGAKSTQEGSGKTTDQRKCLLDKCGDWDVSANLPESDSHPKIIENEN